MNTYIVTIKPENGTFNLCVSADNEQEIKDIFLSRNKHRIELKDIDNLKYDITSIKETEISKKLRERD